MPTDGPTGSNSFDPAATNAPAFHCVPAVVPAAPQAADSLAATAASASADRRLATAGTTDRCSAFAPGPAREHSCADSASLPDVPAEHPRPARLVRHTLASAAGRTPAAAHHRMRASAFLPLHSPFLDYLRDRLAVRLAHHSRLLPSVRVQAGAALDALHATPAVVGGSSCAHPILDPCARRVPAPFGPQASAQPGAAAVREPRPRTHKPPSALRPSPPARTFPSCEPRSQKFSIGPSRKKCN